MDGMFSFADLFGDEFKIAEETAEKEKKEKKEKKSSKKPKNKKIQDTTVVLPCRVRASGFDVQVLPKEAETEGVEITGTELLRRLLDMGYSEVVSMHRNLFVPDNVKNMAFIVDSGKMPVSQDTIVSFSDNENTEETAEGEDNGPEGAHPVTIAYGMKKCVFEISDFEEADTDEITVSKILEKAHDFRDTFGVADFGYDVESATIVPVFTGKNLLFSSSKIILPATVNVCGEDILIEELDGDDAGALVKAACKSFLPVKDLNIKLFQTKAEEGRYFISFHALEGKKLDVGSNLKSHKGAQAKKSEEKYTLPVHIFLTMNGHHEDLTPDKFNGKEKITASDITAYYSDKFMAFKSAEKVKGLHFTYDELSGILSVDSTPGTRGAQAAVARHFYNAAYDFEETEYFTGSTPADLIAQTDDFLDITTNTKRTILKGKIGKDLPFSGKYIYSNRICSYIYEEDECTHEKRCVNAILKINRIPGYLFEEIIRYFRSDLSKEAICRIEYDHSDGSYVLVKPLGTFANKDSVSNIRFPNLSSNRDIICTIHSHNTFPAFWSVIDNHAEAGEIGLFGVIGNLDREDSSMRFRVAFEDSFIDTCKDFVFRN